MRICIAGAGAIGCTLAARLAAAGNEINVYARGNTLAALRDNGISLTDKDGHFQVSVNASDDAEALGPQDLILLCTKAHSLNAVAGSIQPLIHSQSIIIPVVNGIPWWYFQQSEGRFKDQIIQAVDPDGALQKLLPAQHLIGSVVFITASRSAPGVVESNNPHLMIIGEINHTLSERIQKVQSLIAASGIETRAVDNIRDQIWTKIAANLTSNPLSVITRATLAQIYSDPRLNPLARQILHEVLATAAAYSARIRFDPQSIMEMGADMGNVRTSMLQDFEAGLPLESAAIGKAVIELAEKAGLDMPVTRSTLALTDFIAEQHSV